MSARSLLEPADLAAPPGGEGLEPLADRGDVGLVEHEPVAVLALARGRPQVDAGEGAHGAPEPDQELAALGGGQGRAQPLADDVAERAELLPGGRIVAQELMRGAHRAQGQAGHRDDAPAADPAELQARAAQVRHQRVAEGQARARGGHAEPRLVAGAQDADLDALLAPQRVEEALAIARVADRRGRDGQDARPLASLRRVAREEAVDRPNGFFDRARRAGCRGPRRRVASAPAPRPGCRSGRSAGCAR